MNPLTTAPNDASPTSAAVERLLVLVWRDLHEASVTWQMGAIVFAIALGWWIARTAQLRFAKRTASDDSAAIRVGLGGLQAVL
ncbi:MAG: hypothetical protein ABIU95_08705, partial [Burkholderiales bacterium]